MGLEARCPGLSRFCAQAARPARLHGYTPLPALLPQRVADDDVMAIARKLIAPQRLPIERADVGLEIIRVIIRVTGEMPSAHEIERVVVATRSVEG